MVFGGLWATLPDAAEAGEGLEIDPDLQKLEKIRFLREAQKSCFFMFLMVQVHFVTLPGTSGARQSCPKPSQDPKTSPKPRKPQNPEKPSEGDLRREGRGSWFGAYDLYPRTRADI